MPSRNTVATAVKTLCGVGLVAWLLWQAAGHQTLGLLRENPPRPAYLALSGLSMVTALVLAFLRWRLVARAAGVAMPVAEAMRLGALGYACNFIALGNVGGDVIKATLLAKPRPGRRAAAITTVLVDRLLGLLGFLLFATAAIVWTGSAGGDPTPLRLLCRTTLGVTGLACVGFAAVVLPGRLIERGAAAFAGLPLVGPLAERAAELAATYHDGRGAMLAALAVGLPVNGFYTLSFCLAAFALPLTTPTLAEQFFIVPLAIISGALPISPNGLGTIEAVAEFLYQTLRPDAPVGAGTLASLTHRLVGVVAAVIGAVYYYTASGRRLDEAIHDASAASTTAEGSGTAPDPA